MHLINGSHFNSMVGLYSLVNDEDNKEQKQEKTIGNSLVWSIQRAFHLISCSVGQLSSLLFWKMTQTKTVILTS